MLNNTSDVHEKDEIKLYLRGRLLSSMEACWRVFGYQIYPASDPPVTTIKVKSLFQIEQLQQYKKTCDFQIWLNRPRLFYNVKYVDFFTLYDYSYNCPARHINDIQNDLTNVAIEDFKCTIIRLNHLPKIIYLFKNVEPKIIRLFPVDYKAGEKWYFRILVFNVVFTSFDQAYVCANNNVRYETYQECCQAYGLFRRINEAETVFLEALTDHVPLELRSLFVILTLQGFPTITLYRNYKHELIDFETCRTDNDVLLDLHERFMKEGRNMIDFGLPSPQVLKIFT